MVRFNFTANSAKYGGGIFIEDSTAERSVCIENSNTAKSSTISSTDCFLQTLDATNAKINVREFPTFVFRDFINNTAAKSGPAIYGGLLDRCTIDPLSEANSFNGLDYVSQTVTFSNDIEPKWISSEKLLWDTLPINCANNTLLQSYISSKPVQIVFCDEHNQSIVQIRKGKQFEVRLFAVDQVGKPVNATIHGLVIDDSGAMIGRLKEGQTEQTVGNQCTQLEYNVFSQDSSAQLELYADGPCTNLGISRSISHFSHAHVLLD